MEYLIDTEPTSLEEFLSINVHSPYPEERCSDELLLAVLKMKVGDVIKEGQYDNAVQIERIK